MKAIFIKPLALSVMACAALMTGCATKHANNSEVVVAPMAMPGGGYYNGGAVVSNSAAVMNAASGLNARAVYFGFDSSSIDSAGANVLNQHVALLKKHTDGRVKIEGNTDERGSNEYNMALGLRRAKAVQSYLASHGIPASRTEAISNGEEHPADPGHDEAAWAKNRRAELAYDDK